MRVKTGGGRKRRTTDSKKKAILFKEHFREIEYVNNVSPQKLSAPMAKNSKRVYFDYGDKVYVLELFPEEWG